MSDQDRTKTRFSRILNHVNQYYSEKVNTYGAAARGVDWNSPESQELRFEQLLKVCDRATPFSINDYGCGYGALVDYLMQTGAAVHRYFGFDICEAMIVRARESHQGLDYCEFFSEESLLAPADYTVASGVFNVKFGTGRDEWEEYTLHTLGRIADLSAKGFAFNLLTSYSEFERMRPDLYYADPCFYFDYCKTRFSRHVALLHDYGLYEFTILVRRVV